jgi:two-component system sensor histidine kinase BaeS
MGVAVRISFTRGFLGCLNDQELQRLEALLPELATAYHVQGSWRFLRENPRLWWRLLRSHTREAARDPEADSGAEREPEPDLIGLNLRLALLDEHRRVVIGNPRAGPDAVLRPIVVDARTVGWLAAVPFQQITGAADVHFQERQLKASWIIGGLSVMLAAVVAMLLARIFLAPVKRIAAATHRLAAGDYAGRVTVSSSDELGGLAENFNRLALALEKNEQMRRAFMADISHELRTPLAVLQGELEAMEDGVRPLTPASLKSLQTEVATLGKLVNDLYDLSLADIGALSYRKIDLDVMESIQSSLEAFRERLVERKIHLEAELPDREAPTILADPDRLRQLFSNLMENAIRYTDPGGILRVACHYGQGRIRIDFQDSEPGVPPELLSRLFERLYRVESSRNRASGGAGLGLAICRNIVEAHDGEIVARPSPLGGLWIEITFPPATR